VSEPGPRRCNEGSTCTNAPPIVAVRAAISALTLDNFQGTDRLYYAYGSSLYRAAIGATGVDGGAPVPGAPLASFNGTVSFVSASGTDLVVVSKDAQSSGTVSFAPKTSAASATFVACTTKLSAPTSTTSDSDEIFVAEAGGIVAYHR
jgi:hypothetical protein